MRVSIIRAMVIVGVCVFGVSVSAQDKPTAKPTDKPAQGAAKEHTMTGCVQKGSTADTFIVQNTAGKGPKMIGIIKSKDNLTPHIGHKIDITGMNVPATEAEAMKNVPKADHYMTLSSIKMVAAACP